MKWNEYNRIEFESAQQIHRVQQNLLQRHLQYCADHSPFYQKQFAEAGVLPASITLDELHTLPCTSKGDLEQQGSELLAVDSRQIVDIVLSSGTSGLPTSVMYTANDLERLAYNEAQSFAGCGVMNTDVVLLTCTLDRCFVAGMAYFLGLKKLGASSIRNGHGTLETHRDVIARMNPTVIVGVPSFLRKLGHFLADKGINPAETTIRRLVCIGEPLRGSDFNLLNLGQELETLWQASVYSTYASSEIVTTFCECTAQQGGHLHPELAVVEIVDEQRRALPVGEVGEVVVTPMGVEGMPLVRFCTGDLSFLTGESCSCGRNSVRLGPILGRKNQMLKVKGTTLYPPAVHAVLDGIPEVIEYYITVMCDAELSEQVAVHVAVADECCSEEVLGDVLQARLRVRPKVFVEPVERVRAKVHTRQIRKPVRFFDLRK